MTYASWGLDPVQPDHDWLMDGYGDDSLCCLLCVAISRAKVQMLVLGRPGDLRKNPLLSNPCGDAPNWQL